jgi:hypothetical protein
MEQDRVIIDEPHTPLPREWQARLCRELQEQIDAGRVIVLQTPLRLTKSPGLPQRVKEEPMSHEERQIIASALYEYISHRQCPDVAGYIAKRYPAQDYGPDWCKQKAENVQKNLVIAEKLRLEFLRPPGG